MPDSNTKNMRTSAVKPFKFVGAQTLMETVLKPVVWLVEDLLPTSSTNLLCAPPKFGKSIFALQLAHCVAMSLPFLGKQTIQSDVAYLGLEDTEGRMQERLWKLADESTDRLSLITQAETLSTGLIDQMENQLAIRPGTKLFIIDTLQVTRDPAQDYSYSHDYADLRKFKLFADEHKLCVLILHHLRKMRSTTDRFEDISGTVGISGAVDGMFIMEKEKRDTNDCRLSVIGRDVEYSEMKLNLNGMDWELVQELSEEEVLEEAIPSEVKLVAAFTFESGHWSGTTSQLVNELKLTDVSPPFLASGSHSITASSSPKASITRRVTRAPTRS